MNNRKWLDQYSIDLKIKAYSPSTVSNYMNQVSKFLVFFDGKYREPKEIPNLDIKKYLLSFKTHNTRKAAHCAIARFYEMTVGMSQKIKNIPYPRKAKTLPKVIDTAFIAKQIERMKNLKHKAILMTAFTGALRVSEVLGLKIDDIDSDRDIIFIRNGKGGKDRIVPLAPNLLETLRVYFKKYRPQVYLFNGQNGGKYSRSSCNKMIKRVLGEDAHMHLLRHSAITGMVENGTNLGVIQKIAGHKNIKTTMGYTHLSTAVISRVQPLM
jgi:integrase/recombinase XerD